MPVKESAIVQAPSARLLRAASALDAEIEAILKARERLHHEFGIYESSNEALNLLYVGIRHCEAVVELARTDVVLLPAALTLSRSALETSVKAAWMVDSNNLFEREVRWLAHLADSLRTTRKIAERVSKAGASSEAASILESAVEIQRFHDHIVAKLPTGNQPLPRLPSMEQMLLSLRSSIPYNLYAILSQYAHGSHHATWLFRDGGLGDKRRFKERKNEADWTLPITTAAASLQFGAWVLFRLGVPLTKTVTEHIRKRVTQACGQLEVPNDE